jgi:hypothetical protein
MHKVRWQVSLSDGTTHQEGGLTFPEIMGEASPWNQLLSYLDLKNLSITSISLFTADGKTFNLPSLGKNPKFKIFPDIKPHGFKMFRIIAQEANIVEGQIGEPEVADWYNVIEADYGVCKLQLWVDERNFNCWAAVDLK